MLIDRFNMGFKASDLQQVWRLSVGTLVHVPERILTCHWETYGQAAAAAQGGWSGTAAACSCLYAQGFKQQKDAAEGHVQGEPVPCSPLMVPLAPYLAADVYNPLLHCHAHPVLGLLRHGNAHARH